MVVFVGGAVGKLMQVVLANQDRAGRGQPVDCHRVFRRHVLGQNRRTTGRADPLGKI